MSTTVPSSRPDPAPGPSSSTGPFSAGQVSAGQVPAGQVSLTERRKAETRMEIARAAARLFADQGLRATRAEDIAKAAGVAPRTFYRYFAAKEEAIAPSTPSAPSAGYGRCATPRPNCPRPRHSNTPCGTR